MYERPRVNLKIEQGSAFQQQQGRKIFTKANGQPSTNHLNDRFENSHSESKKNNNNVPTVNLTGRVQQRSKHITENVLLAV